MDESQTFAGYVKPSARATIVERALGGYGETASPSWSDSHQAHHSVSGWGAHLALPRAHEVLGGRRLRHGRLADLLGSLRLALGQLQLRLRLAHALAVQRHLLVDHIQLLLAMRRQRQRRLLPDVPAPPREVTDAWGLGVWEMSILR
jgi:hypothetical protein